MADVNPRLPNSNSKLQMTNINEIDNTQNNNDEDLAYYNNHPINLKNLKILNKIVNSNTSTGEIPLKKKAVPIAIKQEGMRSDAFGNEIKKSPNKKYHKVSFRDIISDENIADIVEVENFKLYNSADYVEGNDKANKGYKKNKNETAECNCCKAQ